MAVVIPPFSRLWRQTAPCVVRGNYPPMTATNGDCGAGKYLCITPDAVFCVDKGRVSAIATRV